MMPGGALDGAGIAEVQIGVASLAPHLHPVADHRHRPVHRLAVQAVIDVGLLDTAGVVLHDLFDALQIAQGLLAGVAHQQKAVLGLQVILGDVAGQKQQDRRVGGVVPDAGAVEDPVLFFHGQRLQIREHRVQMGCKQRQLIAALCVDGIDHIQRVINVDTGAAGLFQPILAEGGPRCS